MKKIIGKKEAFERITFTKGKIFHVTFIKKDGTVRHMNARLHVKKGVKGVGMRYNPIERNLLPVFDMNKDGFRMINLSTIISVKIEGVEYEVK